MATANFPVENVSWNDCVAFVKSLNDGGYLQDGFEFRLPTETEWEYAARAGTETPFPWGEALNGEQANCNGTLPYGTNAKGPYWRRTTAVRSYPPNAWGLCDVVGNVWEWAANEGETFENGDEKKAPTGYKRVLRGGSWLNYPQNCRVASRKWEFAATVQDYGNGFRIIVARRDAEAERLRCEREAAERAEAERRAKEAERAESEHRAQEAERRAREEVERRAQEVERRAREAERRAQEAERRAQKAERRAQEAERRAREAAERRAREAKADYLLGRELAFGLNGTKVDGWRGFELLKKAADAGSVDAKAELAELYLDGCEGTPSDAARAFAAAFEAAQSDNPFALYVLGRRYDEGRRVSKDEKLAAERKARAFREFEKRAKSGDVRAKTRLGVMSIYEDGLPEDEKVGFEAIREAAEAGSAEAMNFLSWCYHDGKGVAKDEGRALG
ncbi:MAG: SUMF1/EgtB/PvdO family nonheme iron enzyme [Thermoguttaceae bacterium]|nr:SUMF1/EgtB/PvdO family nonheme iron enzyme [Thermoguttaceae bacterium]